jgi:hypothetical protein
LPRNVRPTPICHHPSGAVVWLDELAYHTWRGDRIAAERFFYDPRQLRRG